MLDRNKYEYTTHGNDIKPWGVQDIEAISEDDDHSLVSIVDRNIFGNNSSAESEQKPRKGKNA